jgi:hypothetical protein
MNYRADGQAKCHIRARLGLPTGAWRAAYVGDARGQEAPKRMSADTGKRGRRNPNLRRKGKARAIGRQIWQYCGFAKPFAHF